MKTILRVKEFRQMGMGIFLHYGLYTFLESGEWYWNMNELNSKQYYEKIGKLEELVLNIDLDEILSTSRQNGFKYAVLTAKHHDGFCLFNSDGTSKFDISNTNTKNDIVDLFIKKCRKYQIKPYIYYATLDWQWKEDNLTFEKQLDKIYEQVELLFLKYDKFDGIWFDGNWSEKEKDWKENRLYSMIRKHNPNIMIMNNSGLKNAGVEQHQEVDSLSFEQGHIKEIDYSKYKRDLAAEVCQTFNDHWGYSCNDYGYKSTKDLINKFLDSRSVAANYLLNLSITKEGKLVPIEIETIKLFNKWLTNYGYSLLGEYKIIKKYDNRDFIILKDDSFFIYMFNIPSGGHVNEIQKGGKMQKERIYDFDYSLNIKTIKYLDNNNEVLFKKQKTKLIITPSAFDYGINTIVRIIKIDMEGKINV